MATKKTTTKVAAKKTTTKVAAKKTTTKVAAKAAVKPAVTAPGAVKITTKKLATRGAGAVFKSPGFRLTVINELLDLGHFADGFEEAQLDAEKVADYETDPRVRKFLDGLALTEELLAQVEKIAPDGGDEVYAALVPVWDGEDDRFDIDSLDDVRWLPNLKRISLYAMVKEGIDLAPLRELPELSVVNIALGGERAVKSWSVLDELAALGVEVTRD